MKQKNSMKKRSVKKRSLIKAYRRKWRRLPRKDQVFVMRFLGGVFLILVVLIVLVVLLIAHVVKGEDAGMQEKSSKDVKAASASVETENSSDGDIKGDGTPSADGDSDTDDSEPTGASSPDAEIELLARLVNAEAGDASEETQIAVASVILNRVNSDKFPDTISEVIYQSGQYTTVSGSRFNETPNESSMESAAYVYQNGSQIPSNVLYQSLEAQGSGVWKQLEGNYFCYE